jgi:hypothetical protein
MRHLVAIQASSEGHLRSRLVGDQAQTVRPRFSFSLESPTEFENWTARDDMTRLLMMSMSDAVDVSFPGVHCDLMIREAPFLNHTSHLLVPVSQCCSSSWRETLYLPGTSSVSLSLRIPSVDLAR